MGVNRPLDRLSRLFRTFGRVKTPRPGGPQMQLDIGRSGAPPFYPPDGEPLRDAGPAHASPPADTAASAAAMI